jgi:hypothetical protein
VSSIRFLVANSVEGLQANQVSVVDNRGTVLSESGEGDSINGLSGSQLAARRNLEQYLAKKAEGKPITPEEYQVLTKLVELVEKRVAKGRKQDRADKIKTIGDAYMVVGGLTQTLHNYVDHVADRALEMIELTRSDAQMRRLGGDRARDDSPLHQFAGRGEIAGIKQLGRLVAGDVTHHLGVAAPDQHVGHRQFLAGREFEARFASSPRFYHGILDTFQQAAPLIHFLNEPLLK